MWWSEASALSARLDAHERPRGDAGRDAASSRPRASAAFRSISMSCSRISASRSRRRMVRRPGRARSSPLHALTYGREQMIFEAAGKQTSDLDGPERRRHHALPFEVGEMACQRDRGRRTACRASIIDLIGFGSPALTAARVQIHARARPDGNAIDSRRRPMRCVCRRGLCLAVRRHDHAGPAERLGGAVAAPSTPSRRRTRAGRRRLRRWRKANGVACMSTIWRFTGAQLSAMGKGALSLDASHAVEGLLDFKVARHADAARHGGAPCMRGGRQSWHRRGAARSRGEGRQQRCGAAGRGDRIPRRRW